MLGGVRATAAVRCHAASERVIGEYNWTHPKRRPRSNEERQAALPPIFVPTGQPRVEGTSRLGHDVRPLLYRLRADADVPEHLPARKALSDTTLHRPHRLNTGRG
jgi:hypothetical protein